MNLQNKLSFIRQKIAELPNAVMFRLPLNSNKLPSDIVDFINIDEDGQLWFMSHYSTNTLKDCKQVFPVRLHFFKRGSEISIRISGKATLMSNISKPDPFAHEDLKEQKSVLTKMTMEDFQYYAPTIEKPKSMFRLWLEKGYRWLVRNMSYDNSQSSTLGKSH